MDAISLVSLLKTGSYTVSHSRIGMLFLVCVVPVAFSLQVIHLLCTIHAWFILIIVTGFAKKLYMHHWSTALQLGSKSFLSLYLHLVSYVLSKLQNQILVQDLYANPVTCISVYSYVVAHLILLCLPLHILTMKRFQSKIEHTHKAIWYSTLWQYDVHVHTDNYLEYYTCSSCDV